MWKLHLVWSSLTYNGKGLIVFFFFIEFVSVITMSRFFILNLYEMKFCGDIGGVFVVCDSFAVTVLNTCSQRHEEYVIR